MTTLRQCLLMVLTLLFCIALPACADDDDGGDSDSDSDTDTDIDSDTDTDTDTDSDTEPDGGGDTDTDLDTGDGIYQWHTFYGDDDCEDYGRSIALDGSGNLVVVGESGGTWYGPDSQSPVNYPPISQYYTMYAVKLDSNGNYMWHTFHGDNFDSSAFANAIDSEENIIVAGRSFDWLGPNGEPPLNEYTPGTGDYDYPDACIFKLNSDGEYLWHTNYGNPRSDSIYSLAVREDGSIVAAGISVMSWDGPDGQPPLNAHSEKENNILILKLNSDGEYQWHTFYGGDERNVANSVKTTVDGAIVVSGYSRDSWNGPIGQEPEDRALRPLIFLMALTVHC